MKTRKNRKTIEEKLKAFETFEFEFKFIEKNNTIKLNRKRARRLSCIETTILDFISRMNFTSRMSSLVFHFDRI